MAEVFAGRSSGESSGEPTPDSGAHPIVLYDGVCGLCNRLVQFILRRDPAGVYRFASLQSGLAGSILARHGADAGDLDSVYVAVGAELSGEQLLTRSDAVIYVLRHLGAAEQRSAGQPGAVVSTQATSTQATPTPAALAFWRMAGVLLQLAPRGLRDWGYRVVARYRYRVFGRYDTCPVPSEETRDRFLEM